MPSVLINNQRYSVKIVYKDKKNSSAVLRDNKIIIRISKWAAKTQKQKHAEDLLRRIAESIRKNPPPIKLPDACKVSRYDFQYLVDVVNNINRKFFGFKIKKLNIRNTRSRWGSCSRSGSIMISSRLLFVPYHLLEYVVTHELAHFVHPNHSKKFWEVVKRAVPNYKERRKELRKYY